MNEFWQGISLSIVAAILVIIMGRNSGELSVILVIGTGCVVIMFAVSYIKPVVNLLSRLQDMSNLNSDTLRILLKAVGVGLIAEVAHMICADSGNAALGKTVQILGCTAMLWLSLPLIEQMLNIVEDVIGNV